MIRFFLCLKGVIRKTDDKDIKISEIEPALGFIESDTLKEYCQSFERSERNRLHVFFFFRTRSTDAVEGISPNKRRIILPYAMYVHRSSYIIYSFIPSLQSFSLPPFYRSSSFSSFLVFKPISSCAPSHSALEER